MGWEDESDNPESDQKRAALEKKQSNAEQRKKKAIANKSCAAKTKNKEASDSNAALRGSKKPPSGKGGRGSNSSSGGGSSARGDSARSNTGSGHSVTMDDDGGELPTVENLLKELERLRYKNETLDTAWKRADHENGNLTMALKRVEKQLDGQQEKYDVDVGKLRKRVGTMQDRVSVVSRLETGLLELCLEVRDRSADDLSSGGDPMRRHERSKTDLLKRCNNDVLVVLDHLRAK